MGPLEAQLTAGAEAVNKFYLARTILSAINESGDAGLAARREVLKRVVQFEVFSTCWPNDRLAAEGLVAKIQKLVNAKDSFTRMKNERESEARKNRQATQSKIEARHARQERLDVIKQELYQLFAMSDAHRRGRLLEGILNRFFEESGALVSEAFTRQGEHGEGIVEQVDGVIEVDSHIYLVEMKWLNRPVGVADVSNHIVRVVGRGDCRGIVISYSDYTSVAIGICRDTLKDAVIVLSTLEEIVFLLEGGGSLSEFMRKKVHGAIVDKQPFLRVPT